MFLLGFSFLNLHKMNNLEKIMTLFFNSIKYFQFIHSSNVKRLLEFDSHMPRSVMMQENSERFWTMSANLKIYEKWVPVQLCMKINCIAYHFMN